MAVPHPVSARRRLARRAAGVLAVLLAGLGAAGCGRQAESPPPAGGTSGPVPGGTAVVALDVDPGGLNPLVFNSAITGYVFALLHEGVVELDDDLEWQPALASGWEVSPDGLEVTYHLRPWVWSDGTPLTAQDIVHSFALIKDPRVACPRRGFYEDVLQATAADPATVRYRLARPLPDPIGRTSHHILPYHVVAGLPVEDVASWPINRQPLSCGEFVLESWEPNRQLSLVRNPLYRGPAPFLERVVFRILPEESARLLALETGEVDLVDRIPARAARRYEASGEVLVKRTSGRRFYYLLWNLENPRFADAGIRRALSLALDRHRMISALLEGYGTPAASPIPPAVWNHHAGLRAPECDPAAARELLAQQGWTDADGDGVLDRGGLRLEIMLLTAQGDPVRENGAMIIRENLRAVGVEVEVRTLERGAAFSQLNAGGFDAYFGLFNPNLYGDPSACVHSRAVDQFNQGHYANARVDSLLERALGLADRAAARPLWLEVQEILAEDPPAAYLFYPDGLVGVSPRLRDVRPHILSPVNNLAQWWIAPADRRFRTGP